MTGEYVAPRLSRITVGELSATWLARKKKSAAPSHCRTLESSWRTYVEPHCANVAVADVDLLSVEEWITEMSDKSPITVLRAYGVLSGILADAVKGKRLPANPAKGVENLPKKIGKRRIYLSADDVARLADQSGEHRALVLVLAYCGLRWGEAIGLRVRDVEFLRRRLSVHENAVQIGVTHAVGPTKGREARSVPVPEFVLNDFRYCARERHRVSCCSQRQMAGICHAPNRLTGGLRGPCGRLACNRLRHTTSAHVRLVGSLSGRQRVGAGADARAQRPVCDAACLRRPVRHRPNGYRSARR